MTVDRDDREERAIAGQGADDLALRLRRVARAGGALAVVAGLLVLVGWTFGVTVLKGVRADYIPMAGTTAVCFVIAGFAILLRTPPAGRPASMRGARALALLLAALSLYAGATYVLASAIPFGSLSLGFAFGPALGRIAPATIVSFLLLSAMLFAGEGEREGRMAAWLAAAGLVISGLNLVGYAYGVKALYAVMPYAAMALPTAAALIVLFVAALLSRPFQGWTAYIVARNRGGMVARRLLPPVVVLPFVLGWLMEYAAETATFDAPFGFAVIAVASAVLLAFTVCGVAASLARADAALARAMEALEAEARDRRRAEAQLVQSQKMEAIGHLTGGMAHDFNNLLAIVIGNLDLLHEGVRANPELDEYAADALDASLRGADLTRRLLAFARRQPLQPQVIDVNELVSGMMKLISRTLGEHVEITLELAPDLWPVVADPAQLEASLANLANNARDAMPNGGRLMIATHNRHLDEDYVTGQADLLPGDYAMIEVSDTGTGMTPEVAARIFEPFFTTKDVGEGTGLGLSMVFGFLKQSGGHINVYSEPGVGTVFRLYLPRALADAAARPSASPSVLRGKNEMVLVVEDNASLRRVVLRQIQSLGYRTCEADSAAAALKLLETEPVDLLFTDIVMPGEFDGLDLARRVSQRWPRVKTVLTSGFPQTKLNGRMANLTARLLNKPYRISDLARLLREALDA